jgi:cyclohexadienyl dehydratase
VNRGGHLERVARSLFPRAVIEAVVDNEGVPERLAAGLADAILTDELEAPYWRARLPRTRAIGPLTRDLKAAWFPIGGEELARDFDDWLFRFEAEGDLAGLRERSGLSGARTARPLPALLASLDERLALMPAVADAKRTLGLPVEDRSQEERVHGAFRLACLRAAEELGIEPPADAALHRFVDAQLRAARFVQEREFAAAATKPASAPSNAAAPSPEPPDREAARRSLDQRIRPALSFITDRIAWLLVAGSGDAPPPTREAVSRALARHALPARIEVEIQAALEALFTPPPRARRASPAPPVRSARPDITASG